MRLLKALFILLLVLPFVSAKSGHINLLTLGNTGTKILGGGTADLYLEIKPGTGRIFIDSFPLTKLDTQISTRFSNEIACNFLNEDCSRYDFFYTIRADASIVGGPSAGSAITVLTIAVLDDLKLDEKTVITGTINSGGIIGPVGGVNEKIIAAENNGFEKVIISKWQSSLNITSLEEELKGKKITIVKVTNLEEALYHLAGEEYESKKDNIAISKDYLERMKFVSEILCNRTEWLKKKVTNINNTLYNISQKYYEGAIDSRKSMSYYSAASLCFSANIRLRELELSKKSNEELLDTATRTARETEELNREISNRTMKTLSDLETFMIVKERLLEAQEYLKNLNRTNVSSSRLAYSVERAYSAYSWAKFFGLKGKTLVLDEEHLRNGCLKKLAEAEERINYVELYVPGIMLNTKKELGYAHNDYKNNDYALCLFKASKAKAEANILMTAMGITDPEELDSMLEEKFAAIEKIILKEEVKGIFPVLGYSYYEYAKTLKKSDPSLSLTFSEYALELSNLDMYFPSKKKSFPMIDVYQTTLFVSGLITGALIVFLFITLKKKK